MPRVEATVTLDQNDLYEMVRSRVCNSQTFDGLIVADDNIEFTLHTNAGEDGKNTISATVRVVREEMP